MKAMNTPTKCVRNIFYKSEMTKYFVWEKI